MAAFAAVYAFVVVAFVVGGDEAISDNWVGWMGGITFYATLLASLVAFTLAVFARTKQETWRAVRWGLGVFPAMIVLALVAELTFFE